MKLKYIIHTILIFCITGAALVSCIDENVGDTAPAGQAYLSLNVDMGQLPDNAVRAGNEQGTLEELKIHSVRVVLYNNDPSPGSCRVEYAFDLDIKTPASWTNPGSVAGWLEGEDVTDKNKIDKVLQFTTLPQRVADKPYKMLVLINGAGVSGSSRKSIYGVTNKGNFLYQLNEAIELQVDPLTGTVKDGKGIFMSNHQGLVDVAKERLKVTDAEAMQTPIKVNVDRMVAKVMVKHATGISFPKGVDPKSATWGLATTNKKTYWVRKMMEGETPQSSMANLYAEDPNYELTIKDENKPNNFNNILYLDNSGSVSLSPSVVKNKMEDYEYLLENTMPAKTVAENNSCLNQATHVVVGYVYTPDGFTAGTSYYIFNNCIISVAQMNSYRNNPGSIPMSLAGLDTAISQNDNKFPLDGTSTSYFETCGIRFCPKGQIYYYFPVRHFNKPEGSLGYYGVVRNNIYEITIKSISVPENSTRYLSADISILPWAMRNQKTTIGISVLERKWAKVKIYHQLHFGGENLYKLWTAGKGQPLEYQTILAYVNANLDGYLMHLEPNFRADMPGYRDVRFIYPIPVKLTVNEDPDRNEMILIYSQTYAAIVRFGMVDVCFVKADGTLLNVTGREYDNTIINSNPHQYELSHVLVSSSDKRGFVFFKHLPLLHKLKLTDKSNGIEYKITDQEACALYYDTSMPVVNNKVSVAGDAIHEPVEITNAEGVLLQRKGIAIICVPK